MSNLWSGSTLSIPRTRLLNSELYLSGGGGKVPLDIL